jgi:hypothetical protein
VHAIDAEAASFYRKYGFESCPGLELHLMLLMKDLRQFRNLSAEPVLNFGSNLLVFRGQQGRRHSTPESTHIVVAKESNRA